MPTLALTQLPILVLIPTLGFQELLIIFLIIMVIFGASKLPQLGRGLGEGISNFKKGLKGNDEAKGLDQGQRSEESSAKGAS